MDVDANGKPITSPSTGAAGSGGEPQIPSDIPKELHKFYDHDKKAVDYAKVAQSLGDAERKITETTREKAAVEGAYRTLAERVGGGDTTKTAGAVKGSGRKISVEDVASDPDAAIRGGAAETFSTLAQPVVDAVIASVHPEVAQTGTDEMGQPTYKDPEFVKGLRTFVAGMPESIKQSLGDFRTANYVITLYKNQRERAAADLKASQTGGGKEEPTTKRGGNFSESGRGPAKGATSTKIWKRSEIREMIARNPVEYARRQNEIESAYSEDRVDLEH